jgi:hypothetical protein
MKMYQISFYVPLEFSDKVKQSMFDAGAGKIGNYESCSFETQGRGQFCPTIGANPFLGKIGGLELVDEVKVEMVCDKAVIKEVILALKKNHPYETPAYHVLEILDF